MLFRSFLSLATSQGSSTLASSYFDNTPRTSRLRHSKRRPEPAEGPSARPLAAMLDSLIQYLLEEVAMDGDAGTCAPSVVLGLRGKWEREGGTGSRVAWLRQAREKRVLTPGPEPSQRPSLLLYPLPGPLHHPAATRHVDLAPSTRLGQRSNPPPCTSFSFCPLHRDLPPDSR